MKLILFVSVSFLFVSSAIAQNNKAKELVGKMTLEEKVNLVVGMGMNIPGLTQNSGPVIGQTMDKVPGAAGTTFAIPRLGIPNTVVSDGPAGLRSCRRPSAGHEGAGEGALDHLSRDQGPECPSATRRGWSGVRPGGRRTRPLRFVAACPSSPAGWTRSSSPSSRRGTSPPRSAGSSCPRRAGRGCGSPAR